MFAFKKLGFTRYESLLGAGILAIGILVFLPTIKQSISDIIGDAPKTEAEIEAETFAWSIRQFHDETGQWPAFHPENKSFIGMMGAIVKGNQDDNNSGLFDEKPMPLDPWDNPFLVRYLDTDDETAEGERSIMVLSKGPNGKLETPISDLWYKDISQRLMNPGTEQTHLQGDPFGGDDIGFVLSRLDLGGSD